MGPFSQPDGHDRPRLIDEGVPGVAVVTDDVAARFEHAVGKAVVAEVLPDIFDRFVMMTLCC